MEISSLHRNIILSISRCLLGAVYTLSGAVKSFDYMGTSIKIEEYLQAFSLESLTTLAPYLSVMLCGLELFVGLMLIFNIQRRFTAYLATLLTTIFTLFTAYIYLYSPVDDCGCFGEALILTNSETFAKNIVLLLLSLSLLLDIIKNFRVSHHRNLDSAYASLLVLFAWGIPAWGLTTTPAIDFLPYQIGSNIVEGLSLAEGSTEDKYQTTLIYLDKEIGREVEFTESDTLWYDTDRYEYIDTKIKTLAKGSRPRISSFDILDRSGNSVKDSILNLQRVAILITYDATALNYATDLTLRKWYELKKLKNTDIIVLTQHEIDKTKQRIESHSSSDVAPAIFNADETQLKSMLRNGLGVVILESGTIVGKSTLNEFPHIANEIEMEEYTAQQQKRKWQYILIISSILLALGASFLITKKSSYEN